MEKDDQFINLTPENVLHEHICCIRRTKTVCPGIEEKRKWLKERLQEGHVFRKLNAKATVFIEYAPLEKAWVPIIGDNFIYIYCFWVDGEAKGKGYGRSLMEYCLAEARAQGKSGVCMLGSIKQKHWLSDQGFAKKFGFKVVDSTDDGYELFCLSFDGKIPNFADKAKSHRIESKDLTIYYDDQCPYIHQSIEMIHGYCANNNIPLSLIKIDSLEKTKDLPCVFNNFGVFYRGEFRTLNLILDEESVARLLK